MKNAKRFLKENSIESMIVAARIFNINNNTLIAFIQRESDEKRRRHNKVLQDHEINSIDDFIRRCYSMIFHLLLISFSVL
jgi:hypothetical protein